MPLRPYSRGLSRFRREPVKGAVKKMGLPWNAYYVLTKAEARLTNSKLHPNSGAPDYNITHKLSDLTIDANLDISAYNFTAGNSTFNLTAGKKIDINGTRATTDDVPLIDIDIANTATVSIDYMDIDIVGSSTRDSVFLNISAVSSGAGAIYPLQFWAESTGTARAQGFIGEAQTSGGGDADGGYFAAYDVTGQTAAQLRAAYFNVQKYVGGSDASGIEIDATGGGTVDRGIKFTGTFTDGIDLSTATLTNAIKMGNTQTLYDGSNSLSFANLKTAFDHVSTDGTSHSGVDGVVTIHSDVTNAGSGLIITDAERTNLGTALAHVTADGSSHTFLDQSVVEAATPTFRGLDLYHSGDDKTLSIVHGQIFGATLDATLTIASIDGGPHELIFANWDNKAISLDQDLRHDGAGGVTFVKVTITGALATKIRKLQLGDTERVTTPGRWILDSVPPEVAPVIGQDANDGEGYYLECGIGDPSQYAGTSGDGGRFLVKIGTKGIGQDGADDGIDGIGAIGDGGVTNYTRFSPTGDQTFIGSAGLPFGHCYADEEAITVGVAAANTYYEVNDAASPSLTVGNLHNITFNDHYLDVGAYQGFYLVVWSMSVQTTTAFDELSGTIMVDGVADLSATNHATMASPNKEVSLSGTTIVDLTTNKQVSLGIANHTAIRDVVLSHLNLSIVQIGGT